jgi:hypothetical protein
VSLANAARLIDILYRSVDDPPRVHEFLEAVCKATRCHSGTVHAHDLASGAGRIPALVGHSVAPEVMAAYDARWAAQNVLMQRAAPHVAEGYVLYSYDLISLSELRATEYWREFMRELGVDHAVGICGFLDHGNIVALSLNFADQRGKFDADDRALMEMLNPHWVNVCRLQHRLGLLHAENLSLRQTLDDLPDAVFLLDAQGAVCVGNSAAQVLLVEGSVLCLRHGHLRPRNAADAALIETLATLASSGKSAARSDLALRDIAGTPRLVASLHPLPAGVGAIAPLATAALFVRPIDSTGERDLAPLLEKTWGLTHAEARLACAFAHLGEADAAATACGIGNDAARTRFKQIYDKTGVHGQVALMRLLTQLRVRVGG